MDKEFNDLRARLEAAERERDEISQQLEADRTAVAECLTKANQAIDGRYWLTEGRGCYEWNDDRWHDEFRYAAVEIKSALEPLTKIAADWSKCPQSEKDVAAARVDLKERIASLESQLAAVREALTRTEPSSCGGTLSDMEVASAVRMLMRDDLDHEMVCVTARNRIILLCRNIANALGILAAVAPAEQPEKWGKRLIDAPAEQPEKETK